MVGTLQTFIASNYLENPGDGHNTELSNVNNDPGHLQSMH